MDKNRQRISRRRFLRCATGGLGTAIALPPLEAMFDGDAAYAAGARGLPRFLAIYQPNGHQAATFTPRTVPGVHTFDLRGTNAEPLLPVMDLTTIFRNMRGTNGPSGGNPHLTGIASWLTSKPIPNDTVRTHSISADVLIANHYEKIAPNGRRQHLALAGSPFIDPGRGGYNNDMKSWVSTDRNGNRIQSDNNLNRTFENLFRGLDPGVSQQQIEARRATKKSVLDFVLADVKVLEGRLGVTDRRTVSSYLDSIRELEATLNGTTAAPSASTCKAPALRFSEYQPFAPDRTEPNIDRHWQETAKLLSVAFQCEAVRSVSYMIETEAGESGYPRHGLPNSHGLSHSPGTAGYGKRDALHARLFTEMVQLFRQTPIGDGNLMDSTLVVWGGGIGVNHSKDQVMAVIAGKAGRIKHNAIRDMADRSAIPLMRTLLLEMGVIQETDPFGDAKPTDRFDLST